MHFHERLDYGLLTFTVNGFHHQDRAFPGSQGKYRVGRCEGHVIMGQVYRASCRGWWGNLGVRYKRDYFIYFILQMFLPADKLQICSMCPSFFRGRDGGYDEAHTRWELGWKPVESTSRHVQALKEMETLQ